jgi:MATE family multidrug resistance protein
MALGAWPTSHASSFLICFGYRSLLVPMLTADVRTEIKALVTIAAPIILSFLLLMSIGLISVLNVGRIGENELAAVGFSVTFLNILGNSWIVGMTSALDTFGTQAFGAKNFVMFSNVMQRSLFLCMMTCIPLFGLFMFNETILDAFHYDINVRNMAAP